MRCFGHLHFLVLLGLSVGFSSWCKCELYTSVEELTRWSTIWNKLDNLLDESIRIEEGKLSNLYKIQKLFLKFSRQKAVNEGRNGNASRELETLAGMENPVEAFIFFNYALKAIDALQSSLGDEEFDKLKEEFNLPSNDDLIGCGEALLRLQKFYGLDMDDIIRGKFGQSSLLNYTMGNSDCFELGKIAYEDGDYIMAARWFQKAFELIDDQMLEVNELLEYMAFAAYKNNQIRYAAELTKLWLDRDPDNERAIGNLEYYAEELEQYGEIDTIEFFGNNENLSVTNNSIQTTAAKSYLDRYSIGKVFTSADYVFAEDDIVKDLCTTDKEFVEQNVCTRKISFSGRLISPELKVEIMNSKPSIIRIYDIITEEESNHLRHMASSRLKRSTVQTKQGLVTSDFRIAKTAWLSGQSDPIVNLIERRIAEILNIDLSSSEDLQVVNYGIGGFYGPHLDSARETSALANESFNNSGDGIQIGSLLHNDRLATVLIYLNNVMAGGATVFPKLNLTVKPIERSAVIWYNIMKNGYTDERTLHTGCPVLLGSKWIATKWPREAGNTFLRPCGLSRED